jgi:hypothetical protein
VDAPVGDASWLPSQGGTVVEMAERLRWTLEEIVRQYEQFLPQRGDELLAALIHEQTGLAYALERRLKGL